VRDALWSPDGEFILALDSHGCTLIRTDGFRVVRRLDSSGSKLGYYLSPAMSSAAGKIALSRLSGIDLWSLDLEHPLGHVGSLGTTALAFSDGGRELIASWTHARGREFQRLEVSSGRVLKRFLRSEKAFGTIAADDRGRYVAVANWSVITLWKLPDFSLAWTHDAEARARSIRFGRDGDALFTTHQTGDVVEWDVETGARRFSRCCFELATSAAPWIVLARADQFQVLSASDHRTHQKRRQGGQSPLAVEMGPRGLLAEVTLDGQLRIWSIASDGRLSLAVPRPRGAATSRRVP
jgi:hypothetical protein